MRAPRWRALVAGLALGACSCGGGAPPKPAAAPAPADLGNVRFSGGDGADCADRVVVLGARNSFEGVEAERIWLMRRFPGFTRERQALFECDGKPADRITIRTPDGKTRDVVFDISDFYGKY
jgi:hypothetical protein